MRQAKRFPKEGNFKTLQNEDDTPRRHPRMRGDAANGAGVNGEADTVARPQFVPDPGQMIPIAPLTQAEAKAQGLHRAAIKDKNRRGDQNSDVIYGNRRPLRPVAQAAEPEPAAEPAPADLA